MNNTSIHNVFKVLKKNSHSWGIPIVTKIAERRRGGFRVLISTILSLRTKDEVTGEAWKRLSRKANTPARMAGLSEKTISKLIYPVGFYKNKARTIIEICRRLVDEFRGRVPDDLDTLLSFNGVGRKTANLVVTKAFNKPGICVDTHVHRISNRWGYVKTKTPDDTEMALRKKLPRKYWLIINDLLVAFGQNHCTPISPYCKSCVIEKYCRKVGITTTR
jgi:endonuclease-3